MSDYAKPCTALVALNPHHDLIMPILPVRKPTIREGKKLPQGHTAESETKPGSRDSPAHILNCGQYRPLSFVAALNLSTVPWVTHRMMEGDSYMGKPARSSKSGMVTNRCQMSQPASHEIPSQLDLTYTPTPLLVPYICWG